MDDRAQLSLKPAVELARTTSLRFPNESDAYRRARIALLAEEIELRRHIERVAELRRQLPPGGEVTKAYGFDGEAGPVDFAGLFGDKQTLVVYSYMYGPQRTEPCPMCTSLLSAWDGEVPDITQRVALAIVARSPIERLVAFKQRRGCHYLPLFSDPSGEFSRDYHGLTKGGATTLRSTSSPAATVRSGISGPARWGSPAPIPARTRAAPRI